jgi:hypothetical protein
MATSRSALGRLAVVVLASTTAASAQDDPVAALVSRAGVYVVDYEQRFTAIVGEERRTQRLVKANGETAKTRALVSDMLLVKTVKGGTQFYRDVISVDGKPVRDRQERLKKLFLGGSSDPLKQARAIFRESVRYDLRFPHLGFPLTMPFAMLKPGTSDRFRFTRVDQGLAFEEVKSPTMFRTKRPWEGVKDLPFRGRSSIDPESGALRAATLQASNAWLEIDVDVRYAEDATLGLLVPVEMREGYRRTGKPKDDHLEIMSAYSNFRRFEVTVEEKLDLPQSPD